MALSIKLDVFEGPFDLLCHLLDENRVDIYDIPIATITEQYIDYLEQMRSFDLEIASEFLVLAATLVSIKAKMLIPRIKDNEDENFPDDFYEDDPRADLVRQILEYKKFKDLSQILGEMVETRSKMIARPVDESEYIEMFRDNTAFRGLSLESIKKAMIYALEKYDAAEYTHHITHENITIKDQMELIKMKLAENPDGILFQSLYDKNTSKLRLIILFLALLEMIREKKITFLQNCNYENIYVFPYSEVGIS